MNIYQPIWKARLSQVGWCSPRMVMEGVSFPSLKRVSLSIFAYGSFGFGSLGVPSTLAHLPMVLSHPTMLFRTQQWSYRSSDMITSTKILQTEHQPDSAAEGFLNSSVFPTSKGKTGDWTNHRSHFLSTVCWCWFSVPCSRLCLWEAQH